MRSYENTMNESLRRSSTTEDILHKIGQVKKASSILSLLGDSQREDLLKTLADNLRKSFQLILKENAKDLALMKKEDPMYDRLLLSKERIDSIADSIEDVCLLSSPLEQVLEEKQMPNGLHIKRVSVPLGVVSVIYESRPNVTVDVFTLCFKTGNACVLKGGKEAHFSNKVLVHIIQKSLHEQGVNADILYLLPPEREATRTLLHAVGLVDICIPRGSQSLIHFVRENSKVPVIETGAGIVHTYFDKSGDKEKGRLVIDNAKTRRVSVCNALDSLVVHKDRLKDLAYLVQLLSQKHVEIFADERSYEALKSVYPASLLHFASEKDFGCEFLSYKMSIKTVDSIEEAVRHIMHYTSSHSEAILAEDGSAISYFLKRVDASALYVNTSTAFTDGGQFGLGAEIGISTQKLHARGPMGLKALTAYKWIVYGDGHVRDS